MAATWFPDNLISYIPDTYSYIKKDKQHAMIQRLKTK